MRSLCSRKDVDIIETNACLERRAQLKNRYGNRKFWRKGYYVDMAGRNKEAIRKYIREQLQEDMVAEQLTLKELVDPFTGEPYQ